ncbi:MAG TPA: nickel pincer cofactor biosynthesis protein LarC [Terracidiphilus sp.]|nr:nickel pincer cofactor biosynthesis protein LarC [Terracidiphilus sp.]
MRIGYLECFSGISGDMLLGALVDAGVPFSLLEETAAALNVGARLEMRKVMRGGLTATKVDVITPEHSEATHEHSHDLDSAPHSHDHHAHSHDHDHGPHDHAHHGHEASHAHKEHTHSHSAHEHAHHEHEAHAPHRSLSSILAIIRSAPLGERVKERASRAFQLLGEAEAAIHSIPIEKVHFHEVGAVDTIADIVCSAAGCEALGVDRWLASPLNVGSGTVKCAHGTLPVPAPATISLLADAPVYAAGEPMERVTPTGAAILRMLDVHYGPLPAMRVQSRGYGAGGRDTPGSPNLLRILVGESAQEVQESGAGEPIAVIEATIDDSSPQLLGYVSELLLAAGAWDVYRQAVQMKKGRTGVQMTVLCRPDLVPALRDLLFRETTTIGLRWRFENKMALPREFAEVETQWGKVKIKIARWASGEVANAAPEYEDCRKLAEQHQVPLKQVMQEAMRIYAGAKSETEARA